jgi:hypothetical protein
MACRAALPRSTDARLLHDAGWRDEGLKGCAARTGQPAAALDPLTRTPRLAVMPFRTSVFAAGVSSLLCAQGDISILRRQTDSSDKIQTCPLFIDSEAAT